MRRAIVAVLALSAISLHADVTVHYKTEMKGSLASLLQQNGTQLSSLMPGDNVIRIKGNKSYVELGSTVSIGDSTSKEMILLDRDGKKYASSTVDEYLASIKNAVPTLPPGAAEMLAAFKVKADSKATGRTDTIQGIQAEEHELVLTMDGPAVPNAPAGPFMRIVVQMWTAKPSEADRVPALHEFTTYNQSAMAALTSPGGSIKKLLESIPGMGDSMAAAMQEMAGLHGVTLRANFQVFMPLIAAMAKQNPSMATQLGADFDPNGPLMELNQQIVELSTAPVPDSQFQVPAEYQKESVDDFMKAYLARVVPKSK